MKKKKPTNIQVVREIGSEDKKVVEALEIARRFKVIPYPEVEKILRTKATDFSLSKANFQ